MFGLSFVELLVIAVVALLVLGPEKIPEVARTIGRVLAELRRAVDEVKYEFSIHNVMDPRSKPSGLRSELPKLEQSPEVVEVETEDPPKQDPQ